MSEFEERTRATLDESTARLDGRVRSRLTQARHAALQELAARPRAFWYAWLHSRALAPAGAMTAAVLVAVMLWSGHTPGGGAAVAETGTAIEDLELLADSDALELSSDGDYDFYQWAAAQNAAADTEAVRT